ncbi:MAG: hypothetical protein EU548_05475 [Promethearchaeota archaeon]|nr:MAG: hypothetical protein EU548_05475 [Candidatus Lokiarchaeota archaeon]
MKAAVFDGEKTSVKEVIEPDMKEFEVLIKVKAAGICGTDLAIAEGNMKTPTPLVLGHEFAGDIIEIGKNVNKELLNQRVTSEINANIDFSCYFCQRELYTQCLSRKALGIDIDGAFAEFISVPSYLIHKIPDNLSYEEATFIEPLAAAYQVFELMPIDKHDEIVTIFGMGKLGLLIAQVALKKELKVIVVDRSSHKLNLAKEFGVDFPLNSSQLDIPKKIKELTNGLGSDIVIDATGNPNAIPMILASCRTYGKIHIKSTPGIPVELNLTEMVVREIFLYTSRCGPFEKAIEGLKSGNVKVKPLISARYPIEQIANAFESYENPNHIKSIIEFE